MRREQATDARHVQWHRRRRPFVGETTLAESLTQERQRLEEGQEVPQKLIALRRYQWADLQKGAAPPGDGDI
ncbi:hypothetical protein NDU88_008846 [Pleurodeles waltl]|uniref:Uncharacterized protein n=1 Tax=Pleurodeles waltl TaxID=8319 RepID=A0AAV7PTC4_PLEWA|nr:hypothetical protein NDU88_008846 [Pleurodeles waltl]